MNKIIVDVHQDLAHHPLVETRRIPQDYSFTTEAGMTVLVEEKKLPDFINSYKGRRLQRQLRRMLEVNEAGINILALRGVGPLSGLENSFWTQIPSETALELLKWQVLGGYLGFLPSNSQDVLTALLSWQAVLKPGSHLLSILAGSDEHKRPPKLSPCAYMLWRMFRGVGPEKATAWAKAGAENIITALSMNESALKSVNIHKGILKQLREVL